MGTVSVANAMAFAPNFTQGLDAAAKIFHLLERKPQIYDTTAEIEKWVKLYFIIYYKSKHKFMIHHIIIYYYIFY